MVERFLTTNRDEGNRLDQFLQKNIPSLSRTKIRKIIDLGGVHVDGRRARKCGKIVQSDENITLYQDAGPLTPFTLEPDHILFQDNYIVVINKPAGINIQPTPARYKGTLYEALKKHLEKNNKFKKVEIGMVQRLDRDTSGAVVFSIHPHSHKKMSEQFKNRTTIKKYLAIVRGIPDPAAGTYHSYLLRDRKSHLMRSVSPETKGAKEAITHYRTRKSWSDSSLIELQLVTGRTHQIRIHCSEAGHPLLGDIPYGGPEFHEGARWQRQCLHSWHLQFNHPKSGTPISFSAPVPCDMGPAQHL